MDDSNCMSFVTQDISSTLLQKLYEQKKSSRFCDVTLFVNKNIIRAHRNVLACNSPYFDSILMHHKIHREQLTINGLNTETFNVILNYMYTGQIIINYSNVEELLKLADTFIMTKLIEYCIEFLGTKLNLDNCLFTYFLTQKFKLKNLGSLVETWIATHVIEICDGTEIMDLKQNDIQSFLTNPAFSITFAKALYIASNWVLQKIDERELYYKKLLSCLQWNKLEQNDIFKHLEVSNLYNKSEISLYYFLSYMMEYNMMLPNFRNKYDMLCAKYQQILENNEKLNCDGKVVENKISVTDYDSSCNYVNLLVVKAKEKNNKQQFLKRLIFGLEPTLRSAVMKALVAKRKKLLLSDLNVEDFEDTIEDENSVKCPICYTTINDSILLEQHLALSHSKDVTYKCSICNFVCQYHGDYLNHMKTHFTGPPFKCDYCDLSTDNISKLISHRPKHLEDSAYTCTFCSFKCRLKQNFLSHLKVHTPDKLFKCDICMKKFKFKHSLDAHMSTHTSEKELTCESCGFHTKFLSHMIAHKRIHSGDIYRCSYPHCKYSTSKKNQLVTHTKTHNGVRPHSCNICGRGFMEKSHLVRHERIHLEEKPFKCTNCDYASSRRDKLKEHFTRHHGENASAKVPYKARPMRNNTTNSNNTNGTNSNSNSRPKSQANQENNGNSSNNSTNNNNTTNNNMNFSQTNSNTNNNNSNNNNNNNVTNSIQQPLGTEIQDLIMHHQSHSNSSTANINANYHHFGEPPEFHHHSHTHNIQHQILATGHNQRTASQHHNNVVNHHMLARSNHPTATSTAAAVAAAMMLDPRFHHNSTVPYHPTTTPVSMAMAAVQTSQQIQGSAQHSDYPATLQNCMTLF